MIDIYVLHGAIDGAAGLRFLYIVTLVRNILYIFCISLFVISLCEMRIMVQYICTTRHNRLGLRPPLPLCVCVVYLSTPPPPRPHTTNSSGTPRSANTQGAGPAGQPSPIHTANPVLYSHSRRPLVCSLCVVNPITLATLLTPPPSSPSLVAASPSPGLGLRGTLRRPSAHS